MSAAKRVARSTWCRISSSAATVGLKGIDGVRRHGRPDMRLQSVAAYHVDGAIEQAGNIFFQTDVVEHSHARLGINLDHDIEVAIGPVLAASNRAEHGGMTDAARPQGALVVA